MNILVIGNPGNNIGDEAAMKGIVHGLKKYCPDDKIYLSYSDNSDLESIKYLVEKFYKDEDFFSSKKFVNFALNVILRRDNEIANVFNKSDLIIFSPGCCGLHKNNHKHWYKIYLMLKLCKKENKKTMFHGCSMGPFESKQYKLLRKIINLVDIVTLRDHTSLELLESCKIKYNKNFVVTSDSALMNPFTSNKKCSKKNNLVLGVTPIHFKFFGNGKYEDFTMKLIVDFSNAINYLYENKILDKICFISHIPVSDEEDKVVNEIINKLDKDINYQIIKDKSTEEALASYDNIDICLAARHHSGAFALIKGVPSVCIAYEHKAHGFFEQANLDEYVLDIDKISTEKLIELLLSIINDSDNIKLKIYDHLPDMINHSFKNAQIAHDLLYK